MRCMVQECIAGSVTQKTLPRCHLCVQRPRPPHRCPLLHSGRSEQLSCKHSGEVNSQRLTKCIRSKHVEAKTLAPSGQVECSLATFRGKSCCDRLCSLTKLSWCFF